MMKKVFVLVIVLLVAVAGVGAQDLPPRLLPDRESCTAVELQLAVEQLQLILSPMNEDIQALTDPNTSGIVRQLTTLSMTANALFWYEGVRPSVLYCPELVEIALQMDHSLSMFALGLNLDNADRRLGYIESAADAYSDLFLLIDELAKSVD